MPQNHTNVDLYLHIRVVLSIILGLSLARLLTGLTGFVQHPQRQRIWLVHLCWVGYLFMSVVAFWWWEFRLAEIQVWRFETYVFLLIYTAMFFVLCTLLFPTDLGEYEDYRAYFMSRRSWFFGLLAMTFAMDIVDTLLKGPGELRALGPEYPIRIGVSIALCLVGMRTSRLWFHYTLAIGGLIYLITYMTRTYGTLF